MYAREAWYNVLVARLRRQKVVCDFPSRREEAAGFAERGSNHQANHPEIQLIAPGINLIHHARGYNRPFYDAWIEPEPNDRSIISPYARHPTLCSPKRRLPQ